MKEHVFVLQYNYDYFLWNPVVYNSLIGFALSRASPPPASDWSLFMTMAGGGGGGGGGG